MHVEEKTGDDLNTNEIKRIADVENSIEKQLEKAKVEAEKIITSSREDAENALETAREEAAGLKTREIESARLEEIEKSKLIIKEAEKTSGEITSIDTSKVSKKLFEEFLSLVRS
ncbi:MAG: hypothetical protein V1644_03975 [Candidatus Micrarchaeota archaeon]